MTTGSRDRANVPLITIIIIIILVAQHQRGDARDVDKCPETKVLKVQVRDQGTRQRLHTGGYTIYIV